MDENILLQKLFDSLTLYQKYAYCYTLDSFLEYVQDENTQVGLSSLLELNINMLKIDSEKAYLFFEGGGTILGPLDYLAEIKDRLILNALMYSCRVITSVSSGNINGVDCRKIAEEQFNDWFHHLGFTDIEIRRVIEQISSFNPITNGRL